MPWYWDDENFNLWHCPAWAPTSANGPAGRAPFLFTYGLVLSYDGAFERQMSKVSAQTPLLADSIMEETNPTPG